MAKKKKKEDIDTTEDLKKLLESDEIDDVQEFVSTGCIMLDYSIANKKGGGIPVGRITELIGENSAGKTLVGTQILAEVQKINGIAIFIDIEHDADKEFCYRIGIVWEKLVYKEYLHSLEEVFAYIEKVVTVTRLKYKDKVIVILWDSIAATPAAAELEDDYSPTSQVGLHARIMSKGLRKIRSMIKKERIALVCTNQLRHKIGVSFGDPSTTAHGKAMEFYASVRIKLIRTGQLKDNKTGRTIGANTKAKIIKNKVGPAWRETEFPIMYDYGIDNLRSIKDYLYELKIIKGAGWKTIELPNKLEPIKFRDADWHTVYKNNKEIQEYVAQILEENLVITFQKNIEEFNVDLDSILEVEQIKSNLEGKE